MDKNITNLFGTPEKTLENYINNAGQPPELPAQGENVPDEQASSLSPAPYDIEELRSVGEDAALYQLGSDKEAGVLHATWDEVAAAMNEIFRQDEKPECESTWRKRYTRIRDNINAGEQSTPAARQTAPVVELFRSIQKQKEQARDQRLGYARIVRSQARQDMILDLFRETIHALPERAPAPSPASVREPRAIYAMLSDVHYGLTFNSFVGVYNSDIAERRVMAYADEIILASRRENATICFVSLMGDMVSGNNHVPIRVENKENIIQQIIGVSELTARFLQHLASHFSAVFVNSVGGNHSRIDPNLENVLRGERMDALIPWFCKARLAEQKNITFVNNELDPSIASFNISNKIYVAVHGDLEKDLKQTATHIEKALSRHVDYLLAGHMHVPEMRAEDTMYIRNGSVCGSGDDYTVKKRLFSPPCQVFMVISKTGDVDSVHTVNLSGITESAATEVG